MDFLNDADKLFEDMIKDHVNVAGNVEINVEVLRQKFNNAMLEVAEKAMLEGLKRGSKL